MIPSVHQVARELRELNRHYDGPGEVTISYNTPLEWNDAVVHDPAYNDDYDVCSSQVERVPGDGQRFDAMAAARRLLAGLP